MTDKDFMELAYKEALKTEKTDDVPIGAVLVKEGTVISKAHNLKEKRQNACAHAEMVAIEKATEKLGTWRLENTVLYVTLEPCPMCAGAIANSRIKKVIFAAKDPKGGAYGGLLNINETRINHKPEIEQGLMEKECSELLKTFFRQKRNGF